MFQYQSLILIIGTSYRVSNGVNGAKERIINMIAGTRTRVHQMY